MDCNEKFGSLSLVSFSIANLNAVIVTFYQSTHVDKLIVTSGLFCGSLQEAQAVLESCPLALSGCS